MSTLPSPLKSPVATTVYPDAVTAWLCVERVVVPFINHQANSFVPEFWSNRSERPSPSMSLRALPPVAVTFVPSNCAISAAVLLRLCTLSAELVELSATPHGEFWHFEMPGFEK